ncbi:MAG: isochorismate synthase [Cyanobacteria bacterium J06623_7]
MSFVTQPSNLILDNNINIEIENFWHGKKLSYAINRDTQIVSLAIQISPVDPLACLQKLSHGDTLNFYWENCSKHEAVAAWGVTIEGSTSNSKRFASAQTLVQDWFAQISREGASNLALGKPSVFCSFTFFAEIEDAEPFKSGTLFLSRFQIVKKNKNCCFIVNFPLAPEHDKTEAIAQINQKVNSINWSDLESLEEPEDSLLSANREQSQDLDYFKSVVTSALDSIAADELSKIVIAHTTEIKSAVPFDVIKSLCNLRQLHPDCYIFSTSNGQGQHFVGASPERLLSVQNQQLVTDALAGSAPRGNNNTEDLHLASLLLKNRKEKREHHAVRDFVIDRLKAIGLKPQQLPLQILKLSNIQHLWTPIYAHLPADIEPLEIVELLHPTPAVAGVSTKSACEKIRYYEKCDRSLYASPLGWVDYEGNCEFIVGIRSALIDGKIARLYAGAGIVSGSNPDKEFAEVQLKLQSLLTALV